MQSGMQTIREYLAGLSTRFPMLSMNLNAVEDFVSGEIDEGPRLEMPPPRGPSLIGDQPRCLSSASASPLGGEEQLREGTQKSLSTEQRVFKIDGVRASIVQFMTGVDPLIVRLYRERRIPPYFLHSRFEAIRLDGCDGHKRDDWTLLIEFDLFVRGSEGLSERLSWGCDLGTEGLFAVVPRLHAGSTKEEIENRERWEVEPGLPCGLPVRGTEMGTRAIWHDTGTTLHPSKIRELLCESFLVPAKEKIRRGVFPYSESDLAEIAANPQRALELRHWPWMDRELQLLIKDPEKSSLWRHLQNKPKPANTWEAVAERAFLFLQGKVPYRKLPQRM